MGDDEIEIEAESVTVYRADCDGGTTRLDDITTFGEVAGEFTLEDEDVGGLWVTEGVRVRIVEPRIVNCTEELANRTGRITAISDAGAIRVEYDNGDECGGLSPEDVEVVE